MYSGKCPDRRLWHTDIGEPTKNNKHPFLWESGSDEQRMKAVADLPGLASVHRVSLSPCCLGNRKNIWHLARTNLHHMVAGGRACWARWARFVRHGQALLLAL